LILPSLYGLTRLDGPQKTEALSYLYTPSLSQALSTPETRLCCSTNSLSGFTSITITARRVSLSVPSLLSPEIRTQNQRNKLPVPSASTMSTCDDTTQQASVSWGNPAVPLKHQATMVKVTENRERDYPGKRFASSLAFPVCRNSYTESKTTSQALARSKEEPALGRSFPSVSEHLIFHSCLHLELLPGPFSSMLYLDKSLSISLARLQEGGRTLHRSTLSLYIRGALRPGCPESPGVRPLSRARSGWGMVTHGHKIMRDGYRHLEGVTTEALEHFRPDFISRSQKRVRQLEERTRERQRSQTADFAVELEGTNKRWNCTKPHPLSDNLFKPKDRVISGKEMQLRSKRIYNKLPEVTKRKEEERRKLVLQTNRLRAEVFKKVEQGP
uniref:ALMS motif domain-containing protein n=1 Tax=Electrophorus electricus TaxID=8005 RepID=A0A4W4GI76_ELEEL